MEVFMTERQSLFSLDYEQFNAILNQQNWFNLQYEFERAGTSLSQSFLIWTGETGNTWLLADFETKKTYDIEMEAEPTQTTAGTESAEPARVEISEPSSQEEQLIELTDPKLILSHLQQSSQGTDDGFVDFLKKINLDEINLEKLKRADLAGAGFSFESRHKNLLTVYTMFCEILAAARESLIDLSRSHLQGFVGYLGQFYEYAEQINNFEIKGEKPRQEYNDLLQTISQFCESTKGALRQHIGYLNLKKVEQLENQVETTLASVEERYNTTISEETEKLLKTGEEAKQQAAEIVKNLEETHLKYQNQLTEKPISQYKEIFAEQAEKYRNGSRFWLGMAGLATAAFGVTFILLSIFLKSGGTELIGILQNLFTKGFVLSPIYVWLNRSIKNHTAQKHLEVINVHRQNALETFDTFVAAAEGNRETRDAVLLAATKAIFDANQSGYLSTKTSGSDNASPVQQIVKEVIPSKPSDN